MESREQIASDPCNDTAEGARQRSLAGPSPLPALLSRARRGDARVAVVFGGQGASFLGELRELYLSHLPVRALVHAATERLRACAASPEAGPLSLPARGFDLTAWVEREAEAPSPAVLSSSLVSQAGIFLTQVARLVALGEQGLSPAELLSCASACTGHSQGVMGALLMAEGHEGKALAARAAEIAAYFFWQGYRMQEAFLPVAPGPHEREAAAAAGLGEPSPMAAIAGLTTDELLDELSTLHRASPSLAPIDLTLDNAYLRKVVSGPPASLLSLFRQLAARQDSDKVHHAKGTLGRRPRAFTFEFVAASAPFHSRYMAPAERALGADLRREGISFSPSRLKLATLGNDGGDLRAHAGPDELRAALLRMQHTGQVQWGAVCAALRRHAGGALTHVVDLGPGDAVAKLTALNLRGFGAAVIAAATSDGRRAALSPREADLPRAVSYTDYRPTLRRERSGKLTIDNRFTRATGRPPVFLPGMTPTTAEAPICAATANAGYIAELAGGGQVTERHMRLRLDELSTQLSPGAAVVVNLLFLDPHLWGLHWRSEALVPRLREAGAPIEGVTVSAGVPEAAEAAELIATCKRVGLGLVSFKPGTMGQIKQVLDIAAAHRDTTIGLQLEGGKAGGHHSFEDLVDLLVRSYHLIREHDNVLLSVGGGIKCEADAHAYLTGSYSEALGLAPMPVDAVFVGTLAMATREAGTSPQVKRLLAATRGTSSWVTTGASEGGMTSGKSQLDAPIYYCDNAAAKAGRLLDEVLASRQVEARKGEIIEALSRTAKPYFGDLTEMTAAETLSRMVALLAIGRGGRYEDGRFLDVTHRARVLDMARHLERRLCTHERPSVARGPADLDEPEAFVERFCAAYPDARTRLNDEEDAHVFVHQICQRPGKPVPFVPVIDENVRRWFKADSLWQSHDERFDADAVLVIPGPEAVQSIAQIDEPVAELFGRFERGIVERLREASAEVREVDERARPGAELSARAKGLRLSFSPGRVDGEGVAEGDGLGFVEALDAEGLFKIAAATGVMQGAKVAVNPLRALLQTRARDRWEASLDEGGRLVALSITRAEGHRARFTVTREAHATRVDVQLTHALAAGAGEASLALSYERDIDPPGRLPREVTRARDEALSRFYLGVMVGEGAVCEGLRVRSRFTVGRSFVRDYALSTDDRSPSHVGHGVATLPLCAAFSAAFEAIFRATFALGQPFDPSRLLHESNEIERCGAPIAEGDEFDVEARLSSWVPAGGGARVQTEATLSSAGARRARVVSTFFVRGPLAPRWLRDERQTTTLPADAALLSLLGEKPFVTVLEGERLDPSQRHEVSLSLETRDAEHGPRCRASGEIKDERGRVVAQLSHEGDGDALASAPARFFARFGEARAATAPLPTPSPDHVEHAVAPADLTAFAAASRDHNPLHRDAHIAALSGLTGPIVHGQLTAAKAVAAAASGFGGGEGARVRAVEVRFTDTVKPGERLELRARHVAMASGALVVDVEARAGDGDDRPVALRGRVTLDPARTAYLFPGQGVQAQGMGMDGYARSKAAKSVWDAAERHCRERLGFSLLHVVRDNPRELRVGRELLRHEQGVLFLTQNTQVAMAVMALAQVAELREAGCFAEQAMFCGHSVGEYAAIGAVTDLFSLEQVVELVHHRGLTMQHFVPRDEAGRSPYRMGVVRPNVAGLDEAGAFALVFEVARETGQLLEVVNHNIRGRQYAVVGHIGALDALKQRLEALVGGASKTPYVEVPGVDVPFHSTALRGGVDAFRQKLEQAVRPDVDTSALVGRYIPNLVARPFSLDRAFVDETLRCSASPVLRALCAEWDATGQRPAGLARALFIEGLAYQFASPVRWIETQDLLADRAHGASRIIEIGVASSPTQTNMMKASLAADASRIDRPAVLHCELDRRAVLHLYEAVSERPERAERAERSAAKAAAPEARPSAPTAAPPAATVADTRLTVRDSLMTLLAQKARVRVDELSQTETIEALFAGNSSKRNQALADIGAELGVGAVDGAHELSLSALTQALEKATGGKYTTQGPYLKAQIGAALRPLGLSARDAMAACAAKGLGEGRSLAVLNRLALWAREGASTRDGALSKVPPPKPGDRAAATAWLGACIDRYAADEGISLASARSGAASATIDTSALDAVLGRYFGVDGAIVESLRLAEAALGCDVWQGLDARPDDGEAQARLARFEAEHGESYEKAVAPAFSPAKAVIFSAACVWARRDAITLYHALMRGAGADETRDLFTTVRQAGDEQTRSTLAYFAAQARERGRADIASALEALSNEIDTAGAPTARGEGGATRPTVAVDGEGKLTTGDEPTGQPMLEALLPHASLCTPSGQDHAASVVSSLSALTRRGVSFAGQTALVTGASERSIAIELVKLLLAGGARVVVTTSRLTSERVRAYRALYQRHGARGSELVLVPFNQGSKQDARALVGWLTSSETSTVGGKTKVLKEPWLIDLLVPFGAVGEEGTLAELSDRSMATLRVLLFGVEALIAEVAAASSRAHLREARTHVLLPLSPNHGQFGNDGLYGETKAALEALLRRWQSEQTTWGKHTSIVGARIGWVRGTGLMNVNDAIAPGLEQSAGVRTFSAAEMGLLLAACCTADVRAIAERSPLVAGLTGGIERVDGLGALAQRLRRELLAEVAHNKQLTRLREAEQSGAPRGNDAPATVHPTAHLERHFAFPRLPSRARREKLSALRQLDLSRLAVIVGLGEVGPWGSARTRWEVEASGELSIEGCIELAWMTGLISWEAGREGARWVDAATREPLRDDEIKARYERRLFDQSGIRLVEPELQGFDPRRGTAWADVALDRDLVFSVPSRAEGEAYVEASAGQARLLFDPAKDGWFIVRKKGSVVKVARAARLDRYVAGQIPTGWSATRYGVPKALVEQVDRTTLFNLVATVEAFLAAGIEPEELYEHLHPAQVGNTQGSGIGGMKKLKRLYTDAPLDKARQGDALQETLINVTAAWVVQSLVGSYGPMLHPVGACATGAVSVEAALDKIKQGQAAFVVAGGFDDYGEEGALGFQDMAATCETADMQARGLSPREMSRPNDRRRRGFVEGQGGGTVLIARADLAIALGLPIQAAVALASSHGDGIQRSIPMPGPGIMAVAAERRPREGEQSGAALCDLQARTDAFTRVQAKAEALRALLGDEAARRLLEQERRHWFHDIFPGDDRISPLRRALAVFGLTPDDVAAAWKHDTSTDANDPNESQAYDRILRWLGRAEGNPLVVVSQKALTGHAKGGAAAFQIAGLCRGMHEGVIPGNPNLDDPDPALRAHRVIALTDRAIEVAEGTFEAGCVTSLGFGHVGALVLLVHPDRVLAALDDEAFEAYAARRAARERATLRRHRAVLQGREPSVRVRTDKHFAAPRRAHEGLDPEHAALLDASSRRLSPGGPIVAGGEQPA